MNLLKIGELSKIVGLPTKTIRFYESEGLLTPASRGENGYRLYPTASVEELKVLKYARDLGLPLAEIKKLMKGCGNGHCDHHSDYLQTTIDNYLSLLQEKLRQMDLLKKRLISLKSSISDCDRDGKGHYCCDILHQLISLNPGKEVKNNVQT